MRLALVVVFASGCAAASRGQDHPPAAKPHSPNQTKSDATGIAYDYGTRIVLRRFDEPRPMSIAKFRGEPLGMAYHAGVLFWQTLGASRGSSSERTIFAASTGHHVRRLVSNIGVAGPGEIVVANQHLYWFASSNVIGRVSLDGANIDRAYIRIEGDASDDSLGGLATDGTYLYFASCNHNAIGRIPIGSSGGSRSLTWIDHSQCPQDVAVGGGYLYWTELNGGPGTPGVIGRAVLGQSEGDPAWFALGERSGPYTLSADSRFLYFSWTPDGRRSYIARLDVVRRATVWHFIRANGDSAALIG